MTVTAPGPVILAESRPITVAEVADHEAALTAAYGDSTEPDTFAYLDGHGVRLHIVDGHLVAIDGEGPHRRERRWNRATGGLRRIVVGANSGTVSLAALAWCRQAGASLVVLDGDDRPVLAESVPGRVDARVLRLQAAPPEPVAVAAARLLLGAKVVGQASLARSVLRVPSTADTLDALAAAIDVADTIDEARQLEASAAAAYFGSWENHPATTMRFAGVDARRVPAHWPTFNGRRSPLAAGNNNRRAVLPVNACLNYCYKLAAVEARQAAIRVGLHPALGFVHLDEPGRENLVWDLLEPVRPIVDRWLLDLLTARSFQRSDFIERTDGTVAIGVSLRQTLAGSMPRWAEAVAPHAEALHHLLGRAVEGRFTPATPLSRRRNKDAAAEVRARKSAARVAASRVAADLAGRQAGKPRQGNLSLFTCPGCGGAVTEPRATRCKRCRDNDPSHSPAIRASRAAAISARRRAEAGYLANHPAGGGVDPTWWEQVCLPALGRLTVRAVMDGAGVSKSTASGWRNGRHVPHPMHWQTLAGLAGIDPPPLPATTITLDGDGHTIHEPTAGERSARGKVNR